MNHSSNKAEVERAFMDAYDEYADGIFRFILVKTSSREIANDLLQETFMKTWDYCHRGNEIAHWKQFLFRTAYNLIVDTYRKKRPVSLDAMLDSGFTVSNDDDTAIMTAAEAKRVRAAIGKLPEHYRDVILLRFTEGLPPREIAEILSLFENVVSVRVHRGLQKVRELLREES